MQLQFYILEENLIKTENTKKDTNKKVKMFVF